MKKISFTLMLVISIQSFGQGGYSGSGYFPIDTVFTILLNDSNFIKIPENSIWHKSNKGKTGLTNPDTSLVLVTDTNNINVSEGSYYFDLDVPNEMIMGGENSEIFQNYNNWYAGPGFENIFWNYEIVIEHQHNIFDENFGTLLYKEGSSLPFDTLGKWYSSGIHYPLRLINSTTNLYPDGYFPYPENHKVTGMRNTDWFYTWLTYEFLPASTKSATLETKNYLEDTTTLRIIYHSFDSLTGGPGWMIKSISLRTYICTSNCPTDIQDISNINTIGEIYPNPVGSQFIFKPYNSTGDQLNYNILNSLGQVVPTHCQKAEDSYLFSVSELNQGVYFLMVSDQNKSYTQRFIKL